MSQAISIIREPRIKIIEALSDLTIEQLNKVPAGFNNNIIWNLGHMVATQQGICYKRAGLDTVVDEAFFEAYKPGTKPEVFLGKDEFEKISKLMLTTLSQLEADVQTDMFVNYTSFVTRYGAQLSSINDALGFLPFHEGLHIGAIVALKKLLAE
jgi:hypothetical protein